jgi:hypothetical protein
VSGGIVDTIISDMLYDKDEEDEVETSDRAVSLFTEILPDDNEDDDDDDEYEDTEKRYEVTVKEPKAFDLSMSFLKNGLSFRQCGKTMMEVRDVLDATPLGNPHRNKV